ncbi:MAG: YbaB/EbfC family nucleoid-associated protein [Bacteroidetes bacterium]|nr:YbaB/EbfC family nucleoid-associated protein [Bacteroidota bacterium]
MEEMKTRLAAIHVEGIADGGNVKAIVDGNKQLVSVHIADEIIGDKEQIEDLLVIAVNRAMENAENVNKSEMQSIAGKMMPGLGGLFGK